MEVSLLLPMYLSSRGAPELTDMGYVVNDSVVGRGVSRRVRDGRTGLLCAVIRGDGGERSMSFES